MIRVYPFCVYKVGVKILFKIKYIDNAPPVWHSQMGNLTHNHTGAKMRAISNEKCISEGKLELQNLFEFVNQNAESMQSYEMEKNIFQLALKIALSGMKS